MFFILCPCVLIEGLTRHSWNNKRSFIDRVAKGCFISLLLKNDHHHQTFCIMVRRVKGRGLEVLVRYLYSMFMYLTAWVTLYSYSSNKLLSINVTVQALKWAPPFPLIYFHFYLIVDSEYFFVLLWYVLHLYLENLGVSTSKSPQHKCVLMIKGVENKGIQILLHNFLTFFIYCWFNHLQTCVTMVTSS